MLVGIVLEVRIIVWVQVHFKLYKEVCLEGEWGWGLGCLETYI